MIILIVSYDRINDLINEPTIRNNNWDFKEIIGIKEFSGKDYLRAFKNISQATASRDLSIAVEQGIIDKYGDKRTTRYKYK